MCNQDVFSELDKERIIQISDNMLEKKLRVNPYFKEFLYTLQRTQGSSKTLEWLETTIDMLEHSTNKDLLTFFRFSN